MDMTNWDNRKEKRQKIKRPCTKVQLAEKVAIFVILKDFFACMQLQIEATIKIVDWDFYPRAPSESSEQKMEVFWTQLHSIPNIISPF